jgi:hypothetical protein
MASAWRVVDGGHEMVITGKPIPTAVTLLGRHEQRTAFAACAADWRHRQGRLAAWMH